MSKQALSYLLKDLTKKSDSVNTLSGSSKSYREEFLDKNKQVFELGTVQHIASEITAQIQATESSLLSEQLVTSADISKAATILKDTFLARVKAANVLDPVNSVIIYNTYDPMAKNLSLANRAAYSFLESVVSSKGGKLDGLTSALTSPDHVKTNAQVRFSHVFNNKLDDPVKALRYLKDFGNLSEETYTTFLTQHNEVTSYYTNGQKIFDLSIGAELKLRSSKGNEQAGKITRAVTEQIKDAVNKAVINRNWIDQEGSDSYKQALFKELDNIAVKHGAKGKIKPLTTSKNSSRTTTKTPIKVTKYKPGKPKKQRTSTPLISLQKIVDYINGRLTEAMQRNMGPNSLVNRTGTFANSARIVNAQITEQGYPSFGYTYQRSPYNVFDPVLGRSPWNTPGRDPRKIIDKSVREIAKEIAIGRFYTRRV